VAWIGFLVVGNWLPFLKPITVLVGVISLLLGTIGSLGLIIKRITNQNLRLYSAPIDYFNLVFLAVIFGLGLISWRADPDFLGHQTYLGNMLFFRPTPVTPTVVAMFFALQAFAIYMPFSKLIHYVMKHFTFTETLWDDAFNLKGSQKDQQIERQLGYTKSWAAPHFSADKTWLEDVQSAPMGEGPE
jgi:nitrate reductase gamma subunit